MSFPELLGTSAVVWECNMYTLNFFKALTNAYACLSMMGYFKGESLKVLL